MELMCVAILFLFNFIFLGGKWENTQWNNSEINIISFYVLKMNHMEEINCMNLLLGEDIKMSWTVKNT